MQWPYFGDFDFAGINIYINEYQKHFGDRANFFIPNNIGNLLQTGSRDRYNEQKLNVNVNNIKEDNILNLINAYSPLPLT